MRYDENDGLAKDMNFIQAVDAIKFGVVVTREAWVKPDGEFDYILACDKNTGVICIKVAAELPDGILESPLFVTYHDVLADDWMETDA
jgi:hypothetical protein